MNINPAFTLDRFERKDVADGALFIGYQPATAGRIRAIGKLIDAVVMVTRTSKNSYPYSAFFAAQGKLVMGTARSLSELGRLISECSGEVRREA